MDKIHTTDILWQGNELPKFASTLKGLSLPRKLIAYELGIPYKTYDNYVNGRSAFPNERIPDLLDIISEEEQGEIFAAIIGEGFRVTPRHKLNELERLTPSAIPSRMNEITEGLGSAIGVTRTALGNGRDISTRACRSVKQRWHKLLRDIFKFDVQIALVCRKRGK